MDNDSTEYVLWPKLPGTARILFFPDFSLHIRAWRENERNRGVKSCGCDRKKEQGSGMFDTVKGSHVGD